MRVKTFVCTLSYFRPNQTEADVMAVPGEPHQESFHGSGSISAKAVK